MDDLTKRELIELAERVFVQANALQSGVFFGRSHGIHPAHLNALLASETELRSIGRRLRSIVGESPKSTPMSGAVLDSNLNPLIVGIPAETLLAWKNELEDCLSARIPMTQAPTTEHYLSAAANCLALVEAFVHNRLRPTIPAELLECDEQPF